MDEDETLRDALSSAFDASEQSPSDGEQTILEATRESRARDEAGRFSKAQEQAKEEEAKPRETLHLPTQPEAVAIPSGSKAPSSWKKEAQAIWGKIDSGQVVTPDELKLFRDEAARRETDFHRGIEGFKTHAEAGKAFERAVSPYRETIAKFGVTPDVAVGELLKVDNLLRTAPPMVKLERFMQLARDYGIDLSQQFDQNAAQIQKEAYDLREENARLKREREEESNGSLNSDIERFQSEPGHEHFQSVRGHMAALLSSGLAVDLQDAYDQAVYANPPTRAALLEQQQKAGQEQLNAQRRITASSSVRGSSPSSGASAKSGGKTLRDDIAAAFEEHA